MKSLVMFLLIMVFSSQGYALDLDPENIRFGAGISTGTFGVEDPDGETDDASGTFVSLITTYTISNDWRLWAELDYKSLDLSYSQPYIGQKISSVGLEVIGQKGLNVSDDFKLYMGAGLGLSSNKFSNRATQDDAGFEDQAFPDRSGVDPSLLLNGGFTFAGPDDSLLGIGCTYQQPLSDSVKGIKVTIYALF